jgi:hypothetical protein
VESLGGVSWEGAFWEGVELEKLLLTRCAKCGRLQHPPSPMCPSCGSLDWDAQEVSGRGRIHSWIVSHHPTDGFDESRVVVLVELDEGVRLVSNLRECDPDEVDNDMPVEVMFVDTDGVKTAQFRLTRQQ